MVPTYFAPNLGESIACSVSVTDATDAANPVTTTEAVYCEVSADWCLDVWGPVGMDALVKDSVFSILVSGVT